MNTEDKRRHERFDTLQLSYVLVDEDGQPVRQAMGRVLNVSRSGICLETNFPITPRQRLVLTVALEDDLVDVEGRVAYCLVGAADTFRTGVEFASLGQEAGAILDRFLALFRL